MNLAAIAIRIAAILGLLNVTALGKEAYSPPANIDYPTTVYWGDTHLHTRNSPDAYSFGTTGLSAEDAYQFAQGNPITTSSGQIAKLRRPLDFLVISDHAEYIGVFSRLARSDLSVTNTRLGRRWQKYMQTGNVAAMMGEFVDGLSDPTPEQIMPERVRQTIWSDVVRIADKNNRPGEFTAFVGYEWTSAPNGNNLHRVVIFEDGRGKADRVVPFSAQDSNDPEDLWAYLAGYEQKTGGRVMSIAHNGNLSNGLMFDDKTLDGKAIDRTYAITRARWEPLYEVSQVKGDGEAHPYLSPEDEFADFETWDADNINRTVEKRNEMLEHEYARSALKLGLAIEEKTGANPFKFGMIASTDSHTAMSTADDDNFFGKFKDSEPSPARTQSNMGAGTAGQGGAGLWSNWRLSASGYAAVWAKENTRQSLFEAMKRREVYASTGPRITVRFFGGWDFESKDADHPDFARVGYEKGVPMGGDLTSWPGKGAPRFLVGASKDPDGANLDRIQIIKGWLTRDGKLKEKIYDVARGYGPLGRVRGLIDGKSSVGNTVDVENATYTNSIGQATLSRVWKDPDFDPEQRAFYYVRVIEIPTPRWTAYDAKRLGLELPEHIPTVTRERAYTSAIWFTPARATQDAMAGSE